MSSLIFPERPGLVVVGREPIERVDVATTESDREQRVLWTLAPRYRLTVKCNFLRTAAAYRELQALAGFYARHRSSWDSFLFRDPGDSVVADHGFGVGDGVTASFQLQRTLLGDVDDVLGRWATYTKPRTNRVLRSQDFGNAAWTKRGTAAVAQDAAIAPDGTPTAAVVTGIGAASSNDLFSTATGFAPGTPAISSVWVRRISTSGSLTIANPASGGYGNYQVDLAQLGDGWVRIVPGAPGVSVGGVWSGSPTGSGGLHFYATAGAPLAFEVWGAQAEASAAPTRYIPTTSAPVRQDPAYWPAIGDGFEPIYQPGPDLALFVEGDGLGRRPLARAARTNLVLYSQTLSDVGWTKAGVAVAAGATAPDGTATAWTVTEDATTGDHMVYRSSGLVNGQRFVGTAYVKAGTRSTVALRTNSLVHVAWFNLATGTVGGTTNCTAGIEAVGGGWFRVWIAGVATSVTSVLVVCGADAAGGTSYAGTSSTWLVWGVQSENGATAPGDYLATTSAAVTRTDATLGAAGAVTLAVAPRAGAALSWSGSFWRRCRFADRLPVERWVAEVWRTDRIELVEVKP